MIEKLPGDLSIEGNAGLVRIVAEDPRIACADDRSPCRLPRDDTPRILQADRKLNVAVWRMLWHFKARRVGHRDLCTVDIVHLVYKGPFLQKIFKTEIRCHDHRDRGDPDVVEQSGFALIAP